MFFQYQLIDDTSEQRRWSCKRQLINHQRAVLLLLESVIVFEIAEKAFHHRVLKISRTVKSCNPYAHGQPESKMAGSPFNFFA